MEKELDDGGGEQEVLVSGLDTRMYNPFAATTEELMAAALDEAGLLSSSTTINGTEAGAFLRSYYGKRTRYREVTKLGNMLVRQGALTRDDLLRALDLQKERRDMKLGEALLELGICSVEDIERNLDTQVQIRKDMRDLEDFRMKIDSIKERLRAHF